MSNAIESDSNSKPASEALAAKRDRKAKKAKPAKKAGRTKPASKPDADSHQQEGRSDRHDEARKRRPLPEIMKATGWQAHTVRGLVSILGSKGGETIESFKNAAGERTYKIGK